MFAHCSPQFARVLRVGKYKLCFGYSFSFSSSFRFRFLHCTSARRSDLDTTHTVFALSSLSSVQFSSAFWLQLLPLRCGTASASASDANANEQRAANESDDLRTALRAASRSRTAVEFETLVEHQNQNKKLEKRKVQLENGKQNPENRKQRMRIRIRN